jgi:PhnB protein
MSEKQQPNSAIVPTLYMKDLAGAIDFYKKAFGATERWRIEHNGNVHVAEMAILPVIFRMHEEVPHEKELSPLSSSASSIVIGLLVNNPDELVTRAIAAGAKELSPIKDYDYGYRQGTIRDPFGHHWCLERMDDLYKKPIMADEQGS